jgi:hypothetical protein
MSHTCIILHPLHMSQNIQALALQSHAPIGSEILGAGFDDGRGCGSAVGGWVEGDDGEGCGRWEGFFEGGEDGGDEEEDGGKVHGRFGWRESLVIEEGLSVVGLFKCVVCGGRRMA